MGVPAFFRWLTRKYASVIVDCVEQQPVEVDGTTIYPNSAEPNPNNVEFDNLYLDMNGIIHPCTHPENKPAPQNEDEMMVAIFECIDRLFRIVRPRKVLYMAIDGVAPRAKMNQQRSRRFRASKETSEKIEEIARIKDDLRSKGVTLPPEKPKGEHFDSNCITPGTPFMDRLSVCLHYYIHDRLNSDPGWKGVKVILSDANVPGEGEHKIMDYIRKQRAQPDHDPNTQHCLCGADADLIMLGLATHEPNFTIIREEFKPNQPRPCEICGQIGHELKECAGIAKQEEEEMIMGGTEPNFIFVRLPVLREYLEKELNMPNLPFRFDLERAIDDWVFMCFFVGNDFLPHLPSLEIRENAIDRLVELYKNAVYKTGGYLTDSGEVNLDRVQLIMTQLGEAEDNIFKERQSKEKYFREKNKRERKRNKMMKDFGKISSGQFAPQALGRGLAVNPVQNPRQEAFQMRTQNMSVAERLVSNLDQSNALQAMVRQEGAPAPPVNNADEDSDPEPADEVRLWEDGFKDRYYSSKFDSKPKNLNFRIQLAHEYVRGLCWVLKYYYQGCASWKWYFPYHYAPFASDFINIGSLSTAFEKGTVPFQPLEQLMGVFPAASSSHVPEPWADLMMNPDSSIIDFYPLDFKVDLNGKKFAWQGVALLPFVDESRLFDALKPYYNLLTEAERKRNVRGDDRLYLGFQHPDFKFIKELYERNFTEEVSHVLENVTARLLPAEDKVAINGSIESPVNGLTAVHNNGALCVRYRDPKYDEGFVFPAKRLPGAQFPPRVLKSYDFEAAARGGSWRGRGRGRGGGGGGGDHRQQGFRPQIGMAPARQQASLDMSGHRMVNHAVNNSYGHHGNGRHNQGADFMNNIPETLAAPPQHQRGGAQRTGWGEAQHTQTWQQQGGGGAPGYSSAYGGHNNSRAHGGGGGGRWSNNSHNANREGGGNSQRYQPYNNDQRQQNRRGGNRDNRDNQDRRGRGGRGGWKNH